MVLVNTYLVRLGLRIETGTEMTTIVDIFEIILQQVRDTGIHLKVSTNKIVDVQMANHTRL